MVVTPPGIVCVPGNGCNNQPFSDQEFRTTQGIIDWYQLYTHLNSAWRDCYNIVVDTSTRADLRTSANSVVSNGKCDSVVANKEKSLIIIGKGRVKQPCRYSRDLDCLRQADKMWICQEHGVTVRVFLANMPLKMANLLSYDFKQIYVTYIISTICSM